MLTDILHAFAQNPIPPAYDASWTSPAPYAGVGGWITLNQGIHTIGHQGDNFHFDNEKPAHRALVGPVKLARSLVTNADWLAFMDDGGYRTATFVVDGRFRRRHQRGLGSARATGGRRQTVGRS